MFDDLAAGRFGLERVDQGGVLVTDLVQEQLLLYFCFDVFEWLELGLAFTGFAEAVYQFVVDV